MTPRERFYKALRFESPDRPPHFEQVFDLTQEACGLSFPSADELIHATSKERERLYSSCAEIYGKIVERYRWDAVITWRPGGRDFYETQSEFIPVLKKHLGDDIPVGSFLWGSLISIDMITDYMQFSVQLAENPELVHEWARSMLKEGKLHAQKLIESGCEIIDIASDFAFNSGPFLSPADFSQFVTPYLAELVSTIKGQGVKVLLHSDGNLNKILDDIILVGPDILQSIDPMAGMDIKKIKEKLYGKIALMGNVQCSFLQTGPVEKIIESTRYCLDHGASEGGYIFSSSNTIFEGIPIANYEAMLNYFWKRYEG